MVTVRSDEPGTLFYGLTRAGEGQPPIVDINSVANSSSSGHSLPDAPASIAHISPRSARCSPSEFDPLTPNILDELCNAWFEKVRLPLTVREQANILTSITRGSPFCINRLFSKSCNHRRSCRAQSTTLCLRLSRQSQFPTPTTQIL